MNRYFYIPFGILLIGNGIGIGLGALVVAIFIALKLPFSLLSIPIFIPLLVGLSFLHKGLQKKETEE